MVRMMRGVGVVVGLLVCAAAGQDAFPAAAPESVGMSRAALERLDAVVAGYIEKGEAVGAELMVIKDRRTVWHAAHGWADKEAGTRLEPGAIYCVRSQTKPLVGAAVQLLIDEGKIALDDPAAKYLPEFDTETHRAITIRNLLEHRSGLPLSSLIAADYRSLAGVRDVAGLAAKATLEFVPGEEFNYSDDGTDTLAAIVGVASGQPVDEFIQGRILDPLGMSSTMCVSRRDDARRARMVPAYAGTTGSWTKFWSPQEDPLFPYFLGSQSLYSTCEDYARFLCLWADGGMAGGKRLLGEEAVERVLTPRSAFGIGSGFRGIDGWYGQLMMVWAEHADGEEPGRRVAFGHGGSDGTEAWMFPERDLIVLYFTQSRGGLTVISMEKEIDRYLIRGALDEAVPAGAADLTPLEGIYWEEDRGSYWAVWAEGGKVRAEVQGRTAMDFEPDAEEGWWVWSLSPKVRVRFEGAESGPATAMIGRRGDKDERMARLEPGADLPSADEVCDRVAGAHGLASFTGVLRHEGSMRMMGQEMRLVTLLSKDAVRSDIEASGVRTRVLVKGGRVWSKRGDAPVEEMTGEMAVQTVMEQSPATFGDWRKIPAEVRAIKRLEEDGRSLLLVHVHPKGGLPMGVFVDEETGRVLRTDKIVNVPGVGALGVTTRFEEFETVGGVTLPRVELGKFVAVLGETETRVEKSEVVEVKGREFEMDGE